MSKHFGSRYGTRNRGYDHLQKGKDGKLHWYTYEEMKKKLSGPVIIVQLKQTKKGEVKMIFIPMRDGTPVSRKDTRILNGGLVTNKYVDCVEVVEVGDTIKHNLVRLGLRQVQKFVNNYDVYNKDRLKFIPCKKTGTGLTQNIDFHSGKCLDYLNSIYDIVVSEDRNANIELCDVLVKQLENCLNKKYDSMTEVLMVHCVVYKTYTEGELRVDKLSTRQRNTLLDALRTLYNKVDSSLMDYIKTNKEISLVDFDKDVERICKLLKKLKSIEEDGYTPVVG